MMLSVCHKVRGADIQNNASLEVGGLYKRIFGLDSDKLAPAPHFSTAFVSK